MVSANKVLRDFAKRLAQISLDKHGQVSGQRVAAVLQSLRESRPPKHRALLKLYLYFVRLEERKGRAVIEFSGAIDAATTEAVGAQLSQRYGRKITAVAEENTDLIAGLRVSVADDVFDASIAGHLDQVRQAIT